MKKILIVFLLLFSFVSITFASNYKLTSNDQITINKLSSKIQKLLDNNSLNYRKLLENRINEIQKIYKNNDKLYHIFEAIKINAHLFTHKEEYTKHYNSFNIDIKKVKSIWLSWHNQARSNLWRWLYSYDEKIR